MQGTAFTEIALTTPGAALMEPGNGGVPRDMPKLASLAAPVVVLKQDSTSKQAPGHAGTPNILVQEGPSVQMQGETGPGSVPMEIPTHDGPSVRAPCDTPQPPPPPRVLRDSGLGAWRQRRPLFFAWCQWHPPFLVYASFSSNHQCF